MDEHAKKERENLIKLSRRRELDRQVDELTERLEELELRYVRDRIGSKLSEERRSARARGA
jgi:hypothetical protein